MSKKIVATDAIIKEDVVEQTVTEPVVEESDLVLRIPKGNAMPIDVPIEDIPTLLSKLVQIGEYRAELERLRLTKEGFTVAPFKYKK